MKRNFTGSQLQPSYNRGRALLYLLFSRLVREEADDGLLTALRSIQPEINAATNLLANRFTEGNRLLGSFVRQVEISQEQKQKLLVDLSREYTTLFIQGETTCVKPYQSVYMSRNGLLMQEARDRALAWYRSSGFVPLRDYGEPEDHLAIELEFMAQLCQQGASTDRQKAFLEEHLRWGRRLCTRLSQAAASPLYQALARLLDAFLSLEERFGGSDGRDQSAPEFASWLEALSGLGSASGWRYIGERRPLLREPENPDELKPAGFKIVPSGCSHDCGARCPLKVHVQDGRILKIMPGAPPGLTELRPCPRGLLYHYRAYSPDRLKYPMKRAGDRGEGKFVRIPWDEALDTIAREIVRVRDTHGPGAIMCLNLSGGGRLHNSFIVPSLLKMAGGYTNWWGGPSCEGATFASVATYGVYDKTGNERDDLVNSRMIILWGTNPVECLHGNATRWYLTLAKEKGADIVCVDPRYTDTAASFASQWIPIRPGTDTAMLLAMAYVIITNNAQDQRFLDKYTYGFNTFKDHVMGTDDGIPKTPIWAEKITGVPAGTIEDLALRYARSKPAALFAGWGPGRTAFGEQYHRAAAVLAALTGNIGIHGGNAPGGDRGYMNPISGATLLTQIPNPVEAKASPRPHAYARAHPTANTSVHTSILWDAILRGKAGGYQNDIKMLYISGCNPLNQYPDTNAALKAMQQVQFVVVHDQFLTPTAKFADILLPVCMWCERNDINTPWLSGHHTVYVNKTIEPLFASKTDLEICTELARRLGIADYNRRSEEEWLRFIAQKQGIPDYDGFKERGWHIFELPEPHVAFRAEIEDPEHNKFSTPSGRIEIFSQELASLSAPDILPPVPKYIEAWEGVNDPLSGKYPLQLVTTHSRKRVHSIFGNIEWHHLNMEPHAVWINSTDAQARGVVDGDEVTVFNDRGTVRIRAKVTVRIMPGVVCIYEGGWYKPDEAGIDQGGCSNVLGRAAHSPGGAFCSNTALVQMAKSPGK